MDYRGIYQELHKHYTWVRVSLSDAMKVGVDRSIGIYM